MDCEILIKSFMRHDVLIFAIEEIRKHCNLRIIVADDSFYICPSVKQKLQELNAELHQIGPDIGLSAGRNYLLRQVTTSRFLLMDNDFILKDSEAISNMMQVMDHSKAAIVGGLLWDQGASSPRSYCGFFTLEDEIVLNFYNRDKIPKVSVGDLEYYECRFCQNFFLGDTAIFKSKDILWNDDLKLMEHEDFFLRVPLNVKIVECPNVHVAHYPVMEKQGMQPAYLGFRGVIMDEKYSMHRHAKEHKKKVCDLYNLKGEFFRENRGVWFDWVNQTFPLIRRMFL
jgi:hypothetical protein